MVHLYCGSHRRVYLDSNRSIHVLLEQHQKMHQYFDRQKGKTSSAPKPKVKRYFKRMNQTIIKELMMPNDSTTMKEKSGHANRQSFKPKAINIPNMKRSSGKKSFEQASVCCKGLMTNEESDSISEDMEEIESDDGNIESDADVGMDDENNSDFAIEEGSECSGEENLEEYMDDDEDDKASRVVYQEAC